MFSRKGSKLALIVCLVGSFLAPFTSSSLNLCITDISTEFACGSVAATWVVNAYTLFMAATALPFGHVADTLGRRKIIIAGSALFAACSLASAASPSVYFLIAMRAGMAVASGMYLSAHVPLMLSYFPAEHRGQMLGISVTSTYVGLSLGPVLGGAICSTLGWRWVFVVSTGVAVLLAACALAVEADRPLLARDKDTSGNVLFVVSVLLLMFGLTEAESLPLAAPVAMVVGALLLVAFVRHESRAEHPIMQVGLFRGNRIYALSNLAVLLTFGATFAVGYIVAIYLENVIGMAAGTAGLFMLAQPVMQALVSPTSGRLSDIHSPAAIASAGIAVILAGLVVLDVAAAHQSLYAIVAGMTCIGVGNALFSAPNNNLILSCAGEAHMAEANATINTMRGVGQSASAAVAALMLGAIAGNIPFAQMTASSLTSAMQAVLIVCAVLGAAALACSASRRAGQNG